MAVTSPPVAYLNNLPINAQNYEPNSFLISNITLGFPTIVTATKNMNFVIGQLVRLLITPFNGCIQLNQQTGYVVTIPAQNQVGINISSTGAQPFVSTSSHIQQPQIVPVGDINNGVANSSRMNQQINIPGSFINVSP